MIQKIIKEEHIENGLVVIYVPHTTAGITINEKAHYFKINKEGRFWDKITSKNNIAFFIAAEYKILKIELVLLTS